jgi:hypothetical protein
MLNKPRIAQTATQATAIIRLTIPREEIRNVMDPGYRELMPPLSPRASPPPSLVYAPPEDGSRHL